MANQEFNQEAQSIKERGKELIAKGNQRQVVLHKQDGTQIVATSLTITASVGLFLLVTGFITFPIIVIAAIVAYMTKVGVELRHVDAIVAEA